MAALRVFGCSGRELVAKGVRLLHIPSQRLAPHWAITEAASPASVTSRPILMGVRRRVSVKRSFACTISTERK